MLAHDPQAPTTVRPFVSGNSPTTAPCPAGMDASQTTHVQSQSDDWEHCARVVQMHGDQMVGQWQSEIDTLMVFAGLFSAILTAFNVESYKLLQEDEASEVVALLKGISSQLNGFTMSAPFINATSPTSTVSPGFVAPLYAVWMNALWFCALVCTLSASSIAITVRQWLLHYEVGLSGTSRAMARLRQARYEGLLKWRVSLFVATIPLLLQIALMLFLVGLLILLWSLHPVVATIASVTASFLVAFTAVSTVLPAVSPGCFYRSPQASWLLKAVHHATHFVATSLQYVYARVDPPPRPRPELAWGTIRRFVGKCCISLLFQFPETWSSWEDRDIQYAWMNSRVLDLGLIRRVYEITWDEDLLSTVLTRCLNDIDSGLGFLACVEALQHQDRRSWWEFHEYHSGSSQAITDMHPRNAVGYRSSRFNTYLLNHVLCVIPRLTRTDAGIAGYETALKLPASKILHLLPPYAFRPGVYSLLSLGSDRSFLNATSVLHSLAVLVAIKAAPERAFLKLAELVQHFGLSPGSSRVIEQLGAQETHDVIAAFPQSQDGITQLVMLDPERCSEDLRFISIHSSTGAAAVLLRELLRRRTRVESDPAFVDDHLRQLLLFFQLLFTHPSARDNHVQQREILVILGVQDLRRPSLSLCATLVDLASDPATAESISPEFMRALQDIARIIEHGFLAAADDVMKAAYADRFQELTRTVRILEAKCVGGLEAEQSSSHTP